MVRIVNGNSLRESPLQSNGKSQQIPGLIIEPYSQAVIYWTKIYTSHWSFGRAYRPVDWPAFPLSSIVIFLFGKFNPNYIDYTSSSFASDLNVHVRWHDDGKGKKKGVSEKIHAKIESLIQNILPKYWKSIYFSFFLWNDARVSIYLLFRRWRNFIQSRGNIQTRITQRRETISRVSVVTVNLLKSSSILDTSVR